MTLTMPTQLCEHMTRLVEERDYQRDPKTGLWLVKACQGPNPRRSRRLWSEICGRIVPISAAKCFACGSDQFGPVVDHTITLNICHHRCTTCMRVTRGCDVTACGYCGSKKIRLLPPVINVDVYGWVLTNPS